MGAECVGVCCGPSIKFGSSLVLAARRIQFDKLVCLADIFAAAEDVVGEGDGEDEGKVAGSKVAGVRGTEFADCAAEVLGELCDAVPFLQSQ